MCIMISDQSFLFFQSLLVIAITDIDKNQQWMLGSLRKRLFNAPYDLEQQTLYNEET